jgi:tRNA-specific 2-thiouridylase
MRKKTVAIAMSGGVDSSVAAALLLEQGYDVMGITMDLYLHPSQERDSSRPCFGRGSLADASRVASQLKIPHYVLNLRKPFKEWVIDNFCEEYAKGRTPNPCIRCNRFIKFDILWERAQKMGADYLATGHYARILHDRRRQRFILKKGKDGRKDQTYFLYTMTQEQLARTFMPVGHFTKQEVRKKAEELGLEVYRRKESQEICFIPDGDYAHFLEKRTPECFEPGLIVGWDGRVLGEHEGIYQFTIGQRRGLKIAAPQPLYVLGINPHRNEIIVGPNRHLYKKNLMISALNIIPKANLSGSISVNAKIRYRHKESRALLSPMDDSKALLEFDIPQRAVTPGQSAVFYDEDLVWGGGVIEAAVA